MKMKKRNHTSIATVLLVFSSQLIAQQKRESLLAYSQHHLGESAGVLVANA
jgi:hypothetical protein